MKLTEIISKSKIPEYHKGFCDDIFLLMIEFNYRRLIHGWSVEQSDKDDLSQMEINISDVNCLDMFLCWCYCVFDARDYDFIRLFLDAKYDCIISQQNLTENEILRLRVLKELLNISLLKKIDDSLNMMKEIVDLSIMMTSPKSYNKCIEWYNLFEEKYKRSQA